VPSDKGGPSSGAVRRSSRLNPLLDDIASLDDIDDNDDDEEEIRPMKRKSYIIVDEDDKPIKVIYISYRHMF